MDRFFADAAKGTLPALTWIDPRQGINKTLGNLGGPNSDHPSCCDVALGERLRKDIYEALRAGPGSVWKSKYIYGAFEMTCEELSSAPDTPVDFHTALDRRGRPRS